MPFGSVAAQRLTPPEGISNPLGNCARGVRFSGVWSLSGAERPCGYSNIQGFGKRAGLSTIGAPNLEYQRAGSTGGDLLKGLHAATAQHDLRPPPPSTDSYIDDRIYWDRGGADGRLGNISADLDQAQEKVRVSDRHLPGVAGAGPFEVEHVVIEVDASLQLIADRTHAFRVNGV